MKNRMMLGIVKGVVLTILLTALAGCMTLAKENPLGIGKSWKEEVLLHDGTTLTAKRSHSYGGYPEIVSTSRSVLKEECKFTIPGTNQDVTWKSDFGREQQDNLTLLALDIFNNTPYIVTNPAGCLAYNHWGRPNPPYVFFRYDGSAWQRIPLKELPKEMKAANVIVGGYSEQWDRERLWSPEPVSVEEVKKINAKTKDRDVQYLRVFVREQFDPKKTRSSVNCEELVYYKGAWVGPGDSIGRRMMDRMSK